MLIIDHQRQAHILLPEFHSNLLKQILLFTNFTRLPIEIIN